ncbi:MAG: hypothetical protein ACRCZO_14060 [Cetobacterium sp.]|uniref:hypothetical protein n=1 Tax=uncultured Cetobacterium sp. TaxID=527638 RepID=UPI0025F4DE4B|nr:hypothetical protein [uncultured Cetobacterium sp.]
MRYAIHKSTSKDEVKNRLEFLETIFKLKFFFKEHKNEFCIYSSFPANKLDVFFISGHSNLVKNFLINTNILEKRLIINSCQINNLKTLKHLKYKKIYISEQNKDGTSDLLVGEEFNFSFNITHSELNLFNSNKKSGMPKFRHAFNKI